MRKVEEVTVVVVPPPAQRMGGGKAGERRVMVRCGACGVAFKSGAALPPATVSEVPPHAVEPGWACAGSGAADGVIVAWGEEPPA